MQERVLLTTGYFHQLSGQIGFLLLQLQASCCFTANALDKSTRHHVSCLCTISLDITCTFWLETNAETQAVSHWLGSSQSHFKAESKWSIVMKKTTSTALPFAQMLRWIKLAAATTSHSFNCHLVTSKQNAKNKTWSSTHSRLPEIYGLQLRQESCPVIKKLGNKNIHYLTDFL